MKLNISNGNSIWGSVRALVWNSVWNSILGNIAAAPMRKLIWSFNVLNSLGDSINEQNTFIPKLSEKKA